MAHYAFLDENNVVFNVIIGIDEDDFRDGVTDWEQFYGEIQNAKCVRTSVNTLGGVYYDHETELPSDDQTKAFRKNYAGIGFTYDEARDAFIPPKPFDSWVLVEESCLWTAPVPMPEETDADGNPVPYAWDEDAGDWTEITDETS